MIGILATAALWVAADSPPAAEDAARFAGEWTTMMGPVTLQPKIVELAGMLTFWKLPVKAKLEKGGNALASSDDEGATHVDGTWTLDPSGHAFAGSYKASNGNQGAWTA